jgi:hypothetical protein
MFSSSTPKRSLGPLEWIPQAKDLTTDSTEIVPLSNPTTPIPSFPTPMISNEDTESPRALVMSHEALLSVFALHL